jgi:hypothetical protein
MKLSYKFETLTKAWFVKKGASVVAAFFQELFLSFKVHNKKKPSLLCSSNASY